MGTFIQSTFISTDKTAPKVTPVYAVDRFTRADRATPGSVEVGGYAWNVTDGGSAAIVGGELTLRNGGVNTAMALIDDGRADGVLSTRLVKTAALSGLAFRVGGSGTGYVLYTNGATYEFKVKTGTDAYGTVFPLSPAPSAAAGDLLEVTLKGSSITVKINGITVAAVNDASQTGTRKGFFTRSTTGTFDDFRWAPLP